MVYYNEFDPHAAAWLRELIRAGLIPAGEVDERDIRDVGPADLAGFRQVHLFGGVGGWPHALRLAGLPDDYPCWTGSCPCQPYSSAGKRQGGADARNLWPEMFRLVRQCRPPVVFGEQVEGAIRHGWLDRVFADLEGEGYACGAAVLGAHSVGAPHIRQRLYWVADAGRQLVRDERYQVGGEASRDQGQEGQRERVRNDARDGRATRRVAFDFTDPDGYESLDRLYEQGRIGDDCLRVAAIIDNARRLADADGRQPGDGRVQPGREHGQQPQDGAAGVAMGDTSSTGRQERVGDGRVQRQAGRTPEGQAAQLSGDLGFWDAHEWLPCTDGKARRVPSGCAQSGVQRVADGLQAGLDGLRGEGRNLHPLTAEKIAGRVGLLRGYGNAIVPQVAAAFVRAWLDCSV